MRKLIFTRVAATLVAAPMVTVVKAEDTTIIKRDRDHCSGRGVLWDPGQGCRRSTAGEHSGQCCNHRAFKRRPARITRPS
jgi:hypothetical protein